MFSLSNSFFISFFKNLSTPNCFIGSVSTAILYTTEESDNSLTPHNSGSFVANSIFPDSFLNNPSIAFYTLSLSTSYETPTSTIANELLIL